MCARAVCDAVRACDASASGNSDDVLRLGRILHGVTAVSLYAHPSVIHASGWLHHLPQARGGSGGLEGAPVRSKDLPPVIASLVTIADPPTPWPVSVSGRDWLVHAAPHTGRTLTELSLSALLHLTIGVRKLEERLPTMLQARARAPLDAARRRLAYTAGATHVRLGSGSVLYLLPPDLAQLVGKLIELIDRQDVLASA